MPSVFGKKVSKDGKTTMDMRKEDVDVDEAVLLGVDRKGKGGLS